MAIKSDRFDLAMNLGDLAVAEADAAHDLELMKEMKARTVAVRELAAAYEEPKKAMAALKENPKSPEANLIAGKYYCFSKGDWVKGLPMLASGNDSALREVAAKDVESPAAADEQVKLGDGWWELAESEEGVAKEAIQERAALWYKRAMPQLTGLAKDKAEKRLREPSSGVAAPAAGSGTLTKQPSVMIGTFLVGLAQRKLKQRRTAVWDFRQDRSVWEKDRQIAEWSATESQVRIVFSDKALGEAILRSKGRDIYLGTQVRVNNETWACELQKVAVVAVWECHWQGGGDTRKLWSNGRTNSPDSPNTWERKGATLMFHWVTFGPRIMDTCTIAPDGQSFQGKNQDGAPLSGKLMSGL